MDIQMIASLVHLPVRKIRYVIDQRLLPGLRGKLQLDRRGCPRSYTDLEGYYIALAALLIDGGVSRRVVISVISRLADIAWPPTTLEGKPSSGQRGSAKPRTAVEALASCESEPTVLLIGDGTNLRLRIGSVDTNWIEPRTGARLQESYQPWVTIDFNVRRLWRSFNPNKPGLRSLADAPEVTK